MRRTAAMLRVFKGRSNFMGWRFQWLFLLAKPHGFDHVSSDTLCEAAGYGFYFWEFGHDWMEFLSLQDR